MHPAQAPQRAVVMLYLPTGQDWWTWRRRLIPAQMLVRVIYSILMHCLGERDLRIKDITVISASDPWSSDSSGSFVSLQLIPGQNWFDRGESLDPGLDSEEFLQPLVKPTPAEKKVLLQLSFFLSVNNPKQCHRDQKRLPCLLGCPKDRLIHFKALELPVGSGR